MTFRVAPVWVGYGSVQVDFGSTNFFVKYVRHAKTSNFVENFGSVMVRFGSIRVSGPLSDEHISGVKSGMGQGSSVRVSG